MARNGRHSRRADYNEVTKTYRAGLGIYFWFRRLEFRSGPMVASILRRDIDDGGVTLFGMFGWLEDPVDLP